MNEAAAEPPPSSLPGVRFWLFVAAMVLVLCLALLSQMHGPKTKPRHANNVGAYVFLRTLPAAQTLFREADKDRDGNLDYGTLAELARSGLIDAVLASGTNHGYLFQATYSKTSSEFLWFAVAEPIDPPWSGTQFYAVNQEGVVFTTTVGPFLLNDTDCSMPPGAIPAAYPQD